MNHPNRDNKIFCRKNQDGNIDVFHANGERVNRLGLAHNVYPVGSDLSAEYEHPNGITLTMADAKKYGLKISRD